VLFVFLVGILVLIDLCFEVSDDVNYTESTDAGGDGHDDHDDIGAGLGICAGDTYESGSDENCS
jgi:hypothetical protein